MNDRSSSETELVVMSELLGDILLEAARCFRQLQDRNPELLREVLALNGIGIREAVYMAQIDRRFSDLDVDRLRQGRVGWSKLRVIAPYVTKANCDDLLTRANDLSVSQLAALMRSEEQYLDAASVLLHLTREQCEVFEAAILANGGARSGHELLGKEAALTSALRKSLEADGSVAPPHS